MCWKSVCGEGCHCCTDVCRVSDCLLCAVSCVYILTPYTPIYTHTLHTCEAMTDGLMYAAIWHCIYIHGYRIYIHSHTLGTWEAMTDSLMYSALW